MNRCTLFSLLAFCMVGCAPKLDQDEDGFTKLTGDCDENNPEINPAAVEICDGIDNDCNELIDELGALGGYIWYGDGDQDGHGTENIQIQACEKPDGYAASKRDCDDNNPNNNPDAEEVCDGVDNDCDTHIDEYTAVDAPTWHPDLDGDGFGDENIEILGCEAPPDHVEEGGDCDDIDPSINPNAMESCETPYDDCNGYENEADAFGCTNFYADIDGDGFAGDPLCLCEANSTHTEMIGLDCDETNPAINPNSSEVSDFIDNDCDGAGQFVLTESDVMYAGETWQTGLQLSSGDYNGDGFIDIAFGNPYDPSSSSAMGAILIFYGPDFDEDTISDHDAKILGDYYDQFGSFPMESGDFNNDGIDDLLFLTKKSEVFVFHGPISGELTKESAAVTLTSSANYYASSEFTPVGDLNNDSYLDFLWSFPRATNTGSLEGSYYGEAGLFWGPLETQIDYTDADHNFYGEYFDFEGWSAAPAGDLNSDGIDDLMVGSLGYSHYSQGEVVLYLDAEDRTDKTSRFYSQDPHGHAGIDVTGQIDINGDGHLDILVSSYDNHNVHFNSGLVYVLLGPFAEEDESLFDRAIATVSGQARDDHACYVEAVGDVNQDGFGDFLIGSNGNDSGGFNAGAIYLFLGPLEGSHLTSAANMQITGTTEEQYLGTMYTQQSKLQTLNAPGDINQDGFDDILISSPYAEPYGSVHLIYGGAQ